MKYLLSLLAIAIFFSSCVSNKVLRASQAQTAALQTENMQLQARLSKLQSDLNDVNRSISALGNQNSQLDKQTAEQQAKLNQSKEELQRQQQALIAQQQRLQHLQGLLEQQRNLSNELKNKMTEALKGYAANDLTVTQKNGKVYVSLSENLLFPSGSAVVNEKGVEALSKLAAVLNLNTTTAVNIEGHTDSIPIHGKYKDNWDLSTARATSIVRILVENYKVDATRVIASGHSYFDPIESNSTPEGRARNRRTEIILSPKLDEMYKLLEQQ